MVRENRISSTILASIAQAHGPAHVAARAMALE